jgi:Zinc carboxypeptidase
MGAVKMKPMIKHDCYYDYAEVTERLEALSKAHSELCKLYSIGQSFAGREVWVMEITNPKTGSAESKPAYCLDAQIHAEEHATSSVALYTIDYLLKNYGKDAEVSRLLDQQVFYILMVQSCHSKNLITVGVATGVTDLMKFARLDFRKKISMAMGLSCGCALKTRKVNGKKVALTQD